MRRNEGGVSDEQISRRPPGHPACPSRASDFFRRSIWNVLLYRPLTYTGAGALLNRVEAGFLDAKILREERTPAALAKWLREAEKMLQLASQQRKAFELIIKKFGPGARLISG
jgi:hypothetical protein